MATWTKPEIKSLNVKLTQNGKGWGVPGGYNYNGEGQGKHKGKEDNCGNHNGWLLSES